MWMLVARIYETHLQLDVQLSESSHLQRSVEAHWVHDGSACIWPCLASGVLESCPRSFHFLNVLCQPYLKERILPFKRYHPRPHSKVSIKWHWSPSHINFYVFFFLFFYWKNGSCRTRKWLFNHTDVLNICTLTQFRNNVCTFLGN